MSGRASRAAVLGGLAALALCAAGSGCGSSKPSAPKVDAGDFFFKPTVARVKRGQTVTWTNTGRQIHTVKGPGFFSQAIEPGKRYSARFDRAGRFAYLCTLHPRLMRGSVVVG